MGATTTFDPDSITAVAERIEAEIEGHMATDHASVDLVDSIDGNLRSLALCAADPLIESAVLTLEGREGVWEPAPEPRHRPLWTDLRPSEAVQLRDLVGQAVDRASARAREIILEELSAAAMEWYRDHHDDVAWAPRFTTDVPDAPRP